MNVKILMNRIAIVCVSLLVAGCQPLLGIGGIRCREFVIIDMQYAVEFYSKNNSIYMKMLVRTPEGKGRKDIKLEPGMHIYIKGYANPFIIVENVSDDTVTLNENGLTSTYKTGDCWNFDVVNTSMYRYCKCD